MNANQALALFEGDPQAGYQEAAAILRADRAELLAALKNAEEQLRETAKAIKEVNGLPLGTWTLTLNAANEARAAISKAEA